MNSPNPFAPPRAPVVDKDDPRTKPSPGSFPWLFVLRYVVGAAVLISGLFSLYSLSQSWDRLADRSFIDPVFSPYRYLPVGLLKIATGVAILARRKISLALTFLWILAFLYLLMGQSGSNRLGPDFFLNIAVLIGLLSFQCLLLARGRLR
jgi:hypothetical protein